MTFAWPLALLAVVSIPALIGLYIWAQRRRRGVRYSSVGLFRDALPGRSRRRHVPFGLFAVALGVLVIGAARPGLDLPVATGTSSMILAFDTSGSMCGDRLAAAKQGAAEFVLRHAETRLVGIVSFNSGAGIAAPPTNNPDVLLGAIDQLEGFGGTRLDLGILRSIDAIANVKPSTAKVPGRPDEFAADVIVVLSDGAADEASLDEAEQAAARGIRIYPIAYTMPTGPGCLPGAPNPSTLQAIADLTGGEFREATTAAELHAVFDGLPTYLWTEQEWHEISVAFAAVGMALAGAAVLLARLWSPLP